MFIPRELGIHTCNECKESLIDRNFVQCGIKLQGEHRWKVFFEYQCPHCGYNGMYVFDRAENDLPGDMFRQFGDAIDSSYLADIEICGDLEA